MTLAWQSQLLVEASGKGDVASSWTAGIFAARPAGGGRTGQQEGRPAKEAEELR
jgi:hypothetical protein